MDESSLFSLENFGTPTIKFLTRRVGDKLHVEGYFVSGTTSAATAAIVLPSKYKIDYSKLSSPGTNVYVVGYAQRIQSTTEALHSLFIDGTDTGRIFFSLGLSSGNQLTKRNANALDASGTVQSISFSVPISGWSSNVSMGESSSFLISSYLANGTRVTTTPTKLGEYRSQLRNASASTFTDTNGSPATAPSASDGIRIYQGNAWGSADTNNEPTKYEIFVGKNKNVKDLWYANAGRTGFVDTDPFVFSTTQDIGYLKNYDPVTGIFTITSNLYTSSGRLNHYSGLDATGQGAVVDPYFDLLVSENALAVGIQNPRSEVYVDTGNGHGGSSSGEITVRNFSVVRSNIGTAITYVPRTSTTGDKFIINEDGIYSIYYQDYRFGTSGAVVGITVNSSALDTSVGAITYAQGFRGSQTLNSGSVLDAVANISRTLYLKAGDVIRAQDQGLNSGGSSQNLEVFHITKVNN